MAITSLGSLATVSFKTSGGVTNATTSAALSVGQIAIALVAIDNQTTTTASNSVTSVTDSAGNVWRKLGEHTNGGGANNAGVTVAAFYTRAQTQLNSGQTITVNHTAATARTVSVWRFSATDQGIVFVTGVNQSTNLASPAALSLSGLADREYLFFRAIGLEASSVNTFTATTNFTTFTRAGTTGSTEDTNISICGEFRIVSGTSQSSNPSFSAAADSASLFFAMREAPIYLGTSSSLSTTFVTGAGATFDDVATLNSGGLNAQTIAGFIVNSSIARVYTLNNRILSTGASAYLSIKNITLHQQQTTDADNQQGCIQVQDGGTVVFEDCNLTLTKLRKYNGANGFRLLEILTDGAIEILRTSIVANSQTALTQGSGQGAANGRYEIVCSKVLKSIISQTNFFENSVFYIYQDGIYEDSIFNLNVESGVFGTSASSFSNNFVKALNAFAFDISPTVTVANGVKFLGDPIGGSFSEVLGIHWVNTGFDLTDNPALFDTTASAQLSRASTSKNFWTIDLQLSDSSGFVENAFVEYAGFDTYTDTTDSQGICSFLVLANEQDPSPLATDDGGYASYVLSVLDREEYVRTIKSYNHIAIEEEVINDRQIGSTDSPAGLALILDDGITEPDSTLVGAYTGFSQSATTIAITANKTISEAYDSRKLYWRNNDGVEPPVKIGDIADFGDADIEIDGAVLSSDSKYTSIRTTGTVTFLDGGSINAGYTDSTGSYNKLRLFGIPNVVNAIVLIKDLTTNVESFPTIASGEAIVTIRSDRNYQIRADAPGYSASRLITISGATTREFEFTLENRRDIYEAGTNISSQVIFDPVSYEITITDESLELELADVYRTIEDYLATSDGLRYTAHPYPVVLPDRRIFWFPYDAVADQVNPARIIPDPGNTADPALLFEVYLEGASDPTYDLFDFSAADGKIIRVRSQVAIALGGFSAEDRTTVDAIATRTARIDGLVENSGGDRFTAKALEQAPASSGGSEDAPTVEEIREELDNNSTKLATIQDQTVNLPTKTDLINELKRAINRIFGVLH